jgi:hypothetical protein
MESQLWNHNKRKSNYDFFFCVSVEYDMFVIYSECISTPVELEKYARPGTVGIEPTTFPKRIYTQSNITNIKKQLITNLSQLN